MELIAVGLADKQIAARLGLSHSTVRTHIQRIYATHGLSNRAEAAATWIAAAAASPDSGPERTAALTWLFARPARVMAALGIAVAAVIAVAAAAVTLLPQRGTPDQMLTAINSDRSGLRSVIWSDCLATAAQAAARHLADNGYVLERVQALRPRQCGGGAGVQVAVYWSGADLAAANRILDADPTMRTAIRGPYQHAGAAWAVGGTGVAFLVVLLN